MWEIDNRTPFAAERGWVRDRNGAEVWLVAVKCTFDILPDGTTAVSPEQPPVLRCPEYHGAPGDSSVKYEADLVLTKTTTDVLVVGHAYTPGGQAVSELQVGFQVGPVRKVLRIIGDRRWNGDRPTAPVPFVKMPLVYERAFGGVDPKSEYPDRDYAWANPVGAGFAVAPEHLEDAPLPNVEYPGQALTARADRPQPAGFGAIPSYWPPRVQLAGTYDERWLRERQPLLPDDFDDRFFQCAPADQQAPAFLRGGEPVALHHLTPRGALQFRLPRMFLGFDTRFYGGSREIHKERRLHTVILEPDYPRVSLVWHTALPCHFKVQKLERTIVTLKTELRTRAAADEPEAVEPA